MQLAAFPIAQPVVCCSSAIHVIAPASLECWMYQSLVGCLLSPASSRCHGPGLVSLNVVKCSTSCICGAGEVVVGMLSQSVRQSL